MNNYNNLVPLRKYIKKSFNETTFEEIVNQGNLMLLERVSKEQQEKGQRFMADKEISVFYQLRKWLSERWNKKITTKKEMLKKHLEFNRLSYLLNISRDSLGKCDKDIKNYIKNITNSNPEWLALKDKNSSLRQENERLAYLTFGTPAFDKKTTDDWQINITEKELKKIIRKEIILHEYGHLFEYLKEVIKK